MYADSESEAMKAAIVENTRRRAAQLQYNEAHHIVPQTAQRAIETGWENFFPSAGADTPVDDAERAAEIGVLQDEMVKAAAEMRYEDAAKLRDRLVKLHAPTNYVKEETQKYGKKRRKTMKGSKKRMKNDGQNA
jgi:excinuclease ABC subunit B